MIGAPAARRLTQRFTTPIAYWVGRHNLAALFLFGPVILFLAGALMFPLLLVLELSAYQRGAAGVVIETVSAGNYLRFLGEPVYLLILLNSAVLGILVCVITVAVAYVPACVLGLTRSSARTVLILLIFVPFWTSFIVRTYAWIVMLGTNGVINGAGKSIGLLSAPIPLLYAKGTVVLGLVHALLPFAIVPIFAAIERIDDSILESAATLGARPLAVFREIIVPISLPGVISAAILVFIEAMGAFITPQLLGGPSDMMIAQLIQERFLGSFDWPFGAAVSVIYLVFTAAIFVLFTYARGLVTRAMQ